MRACARRSSKRRAGPSPPASAAHPCRRAAERCVPALPRLSTATAPVHDGPSRHSSGTSASSARTLAKRLWRFEPELRFGMDGAAQRGDALGNRVGVLEQILCQHHGIITSRANALASYGPRRRARVFRFRCNADSSVCSPPFRCPDGNRASAYGRIAYADDILGSLLVFDGFVAGRDLCGRQHDRGHSPASRQDQCRKGTNSIALRPTAE